jgi:hypothetical protein
MAPYAYFLTGVTLIIVESTGLTQPDKVWFVALSRTEETFVGISAVLIITPLFRLRRPRLEFQQLASSAVDQLKNLTTIMPVAAWLASIFTSYEIPLGRPGHVRSFQNLLQTALCAP